MNSKLVREDSKDVLFIGDGLCGRCYACVTGGSHPCQQLEDGTQSPLQTPDSDVIGMGNSKLLREDSKDVLFIGDGLCGRCCTCVTGGSDPCQLREGVPESPLQTPDSDVVGMVNSKLVCDDNDLFIGDGLCGRCYACVTGGSHPCQSPSLIPDSDAVGVGIERSSINAIV